MIQKMTLLYGLTQETFELLKSRLDSMYPDISDHKKKIFSWKFEGDPVCQLDLYNLTFKAGGECYICQAYIDFPKFGCAYEDFGTVLYKKYEALFAVSKLADFPAYDSSVCDFIEYAAECKADDADKTLQKFAQNFGFKPEQLDRTRWHEYKTHFGTNHFRMTKLSGDQIVISAKCDGTVLKKRIGNDHVNRDGGVIPSAAVNREDEERILHWMKTKINSYNRINRQVTPPREMTSVLSGVDLTAAEELISLAERHGLTPQVRYAPGHKTWKCVYSQKKPKRVIFTLVNVPPGV